MERVIYKLVHTYESGDITIIECKGILLHPKIACAIELERPLTDPAHFDRLIKVVENAKIEFMRLSAILTIQTPPSQ